MISRDDSDGWKSALVQVGYECTHEHVAFLQFTAADLPPIDLMRVAEETFAKMLSAAESWAVLGVEVRIPSLNICSPLNFTPRDMPRLIAATRTSSTSSILWTRTKWMYPMNSSGSCARNTGRRKFMRTFSNRGERRDLAVPELDLPVLPKAARRPPVLTMDQYFQWNAEMDTVESMPSVEDRCTVPFDLR
jgi:hypothetical protein